MLLLMPAIVLAGVLTLPTPAAAQTASVSIANGLVSVRAQQASVRQIIEAWSNASGAVVVNIELLPALPTNLELAAVPEREALEIILRDAAAGYILARDSGLPTSGFTVNRILIAPRSASGGRALAAPSRVPVARQPSARAVPPPAPVAESEPIALVEPVMFDEPVPAPMPQTYTPPPATEGMSPIGGASPFGITAGAAVPGAVVPAEAPSEHTGSPSGHRPRSAATPRQDPQTP